MKGGGESIMVADDDRMVRRILGAKLRGLGYEVVEATDGKEALKMVEEEAPDLVITDSMMPRLSGLQLVRRMRESPQEEVSSVPVIMITSRGAEADVVEGLESGLDDYVTKPFSPDEIAARVRAMLRRSGRGQR